MRLDARTMPERGTFVNLASGQIVRWVRWHDTDTGEFEAFKTDPVIARELGIPLTRLLYRGRAALRFVPTHRTSGASGRLAPSTPLDEIRREVLAGRRMARPIIYVAGAPIPECNEPKCHRPARWECIIEQLVEPEKDTAGRLHERAVCLDVTRWCDWHYRPPRQLSERGVESEIEVVARPS